MSREFDVYDLIDYDNVTDSLPLRDWALHNEKDNAEAEDALWQELYEDFYQGARQHPRYQEMIDDAQFNHNRRKAVGPRPVGKYEGFKDKAVMAGGTILGGAIGTAMGKSVPGKIGKGVLGGAAGFTVTGVNRAFNRFNKDYDYIEEQAGPERDSGAYDEVFRDAIDAVSSNPKYFIQPEKTAGAVYETFEKLASNNPRLAERIADRVLEKLADFEDDVLPVGELAGAGTALVGSQLQGFKLMNELGGIEGNPENARYVKDQAKNLGLDSVLLKDIPNDLMGAAVPKGQTKKVKGDFIWEALNNQRGAEEFTPEELERAKKHGVAWFGDRTKGIGLHELFHHKNHNTPVVGKFFGLRQAPALPMAALAMSGKLREEVKGIDGDAQYADKAMDWIGRNPELATALGYSPMLSDEMLASGRAFNHLRKTEGLEHAAKESKLLGKALLTYMGVAGAGALTAGAASRLFRKDEPEKTALAALSDLEKLASENPEFAEKVAARLLEKLADADEDTTSKEMMSVGLMGGGAGAVSHANNRGLIHGREKLYHGTSAKNADGILREGLKAKKTVDPNDITGQLIKNFQNAGIDYDYSEFDNKVYMARNKGLADQMAMNVGGPFGGGKTLEARVPTWKLNEVDNPEVKVHKIMRENDEVLDKFVPDHVQGTMRDIQKKIVKKQLEQSDRVLDRAGTFVNDGDVDAKYFKGSKNYERLNPKEIMEYAKANPKRFLKGLGIGALGVGAIGAGAVGLGAPNPTEIAEMISNKND